MTETPSFDLQATIRETTKILREIDALVRRSADMSVSFEERRAAAMDACELIVTSGALDKLTALAAVIEKNAGRLPTAMKAAAMIKHFVGGR